MNKQLCWSQEQIAMAEEEEETRTVHLLHHFLQVKQLNCWMQTEQSLEKDMFQLFQMEKIALSKLMNGLCTIQWLRNTQLVNKLLGLLLIYE